TVLMSRSNSRAIAFFDFPRNRISRIAAAVPWPISSSSTVPLGTASRLADPSCSVTDSPFVVAPGGGIFSWPDGGILGWPPTVHRGWNSAPHSVAHVHTGGGTVLRAGGTRAHQGRNSAPRRWRTCTPGVEQCSAQVAHVHTRGGTVLRAGGARAHQGWNSAPRRWRTCTPGCGAGNLCATPAPEP